MKKEVRKELATTADREKGTYARYEVRICGRQHPNARTMKKNAATLCLAIETTVQGSVN